jgi:energy-coupling factor transport system ATP-binding protein
MMFDDPDRQIVALTVFEDVIFGPANLGLPREEIFERAKYAIDAVRLVGYESRNPRTLSGGEQQSLSVAGVVAMRPNILVMDEPICMLDPIGKERVLEVIEDLKKNFNMTIIITESGTDIERVAAFADEIVLLQDGEIRAQGSAREIFGNQTLLEGTRLRVPQVTELALLMGEKSSSKLPISLDEGIEYFSRKIKGKKVSRYKRKEEIIKKGKTIIECENLRHVYPGPPPFEALRGVSFKISEGEMVGLIGQNGSGKTTLSYHLVGLLKASNPDSSLIVAGVDANDEKTAVHDLTQHINYLFQNPENQLFSDTVIHEMEYGLRNQGLSEEEITKKAEEAMKLFEIEDYRDKFIEPLPLNIKTFLGTASLVAMEPKILIIDEPTTGLDWESSVRIMRILQDLNAKGVTVIIISHNMELISEYVDRVMVMRQGLIIMDGPVREIFSQPEKLKEAWLSPCQITLLGQNMKEFGMPSDVLTVSEMHKIMSEYMK